MKDVQLQASKRTIIVHAGRHKTGTSAIQHFLFNNRERLAECGYYYPKAGFLHGEPAHHAVALALNPNGKAFSSEVAHRVLRNFTREINLAEGTIVTSSEQYQNISPWRLAKFLPGWEIRVIVYLRDHLHYLVSSYQQLVHARTVSMTLEEYRANKFRVVYSDMLDAWASCFGPHNLSVCVYDKSLIRNGNVVEDFIWRLTGQDAAHFGQVVGRDVNPSLGEPLLEFKRRINAHLPNEAEQQKVLYGALSRLAARNPRLREKPQLTQEFIDQVKAFTQPDVDRLLTGYIASGHNPFGFTWPRIGDNMDWPCNASAIMAKLKAVAPRAEAYIRAKVPDEALNSATFSTRRSAFQELPH